MITTVLFASMLAGSNPFAAEGAILEYMPQPCQPLSVSDNGAVIVGGFGTASQHGEAFVWTRAGGMQSLGEGAPRAVSKDGSEVIGVYGKTTRAFIVSNGERVDLGLPEGASQVFAHGLDGSAVYGYADRGKGLMYPVKFDRKEQTWKWMGDETGIVWGAEGNSGVVFGSLGNDPAVFRPESRSWERVVQPTNNWQGIVNSVSADGKTFVGAIHGGTGTPSEAFIKRGKETFVLNDYPGGDTFTIATDVTATGEFVVGQATKSSKQTRVSGGDTAIIWSERTGMVDLNELLQGQYGIDLAGVRLTSVQAITPDGRVLVGFGVRGKTNVGYRLEFR